MYQEIYVYIIPLTKNNNNIFSSTFYQSNNIEKINTSKSGETFCTPYKCIFNTFNHKTRSHHGGKPRKVWMKWRAPRTAMLASWPRLRSSREPGVLYKPAKHVISA